MKHHLQWFRLWAEAVDDEKLRLLAFEDRWHFVALLCCKAQTLLDEPGELMRRKVAVKLGLQVRELEEVGRRLAEVGLIDADSLQPIAWQSRQFCSDISTERVKRFRDKKRGETLQKRSVDVTETPPETETETETETEEDNPPSEGVPPRPMAAPAPAPETPPIKAENATKADTTPPCPYEAIRDLWIAICPTCTKPVPVANWTDNRRAVIRSRWKDQLPDLESWETTFRMVAASKFLTGRCEGRNGSKPFVADLFWVAKPENLLKIYEGRYSNA